MRREDQITGNIDWLTVLIYAILVAIGWFTIYSAVYEDNGQSIFNRDFNSGKQFVWIVVCTLMALTILVIDSRFYVTFSYVIFAVLMVLLLGVLFFGATINGSKSWIKLGGFQIQPSEMAKFATSLAIAKYMSLLNIDIRKLKHKLVVFGIIAIPVGLILAQGDVGSAIVFSVFFLVLFREGLESYFLIIGATMLFLSVLALLISKFILLGIFAAISLVIIYFFKKNRTAIFFTIIVAVVSSLYVFSVDFIFNKMKPHQQARINVLLGKDTGGKNDYNVRQSIIAIGSGGVLGKGYLQGTQTKGKYVPEQSTDFIFSSWGEEFGFVGTIVLIALFTLLFLRILYLAERQRSKFSRVYGYCVACILFFHFVINIGMVIGVVPVIGIPLPFISYGGSSLLSFTALLFVFIRLDAQRVAMLR